MTLKITLVSLFKLVHTIPKGLPKSWAEKDSNQRTSTVFLEKSENKQKVQTCTFIPGIIDCAQPSQNRWTHYNSYI